MKDKDRKDNNDAPNGKLISENRKARYEYFIEDTLEAGIVLVGSEVKSLRTGRATINEAHAGEMKGELWIFNLTIPVYEAANRFNHEPKRPRKLLVQQKQMKKLLGQVKVQGYTLVPLKMYFTARGYVKVLLGLGKGKKEYEKRDTVKKREWERQQRSMLKKNR